jgi:mRNA-degrading endonuclease YafQ of YafQ-DinJ toxin-antitoxin module
MNVEQSGRFKKAYKKLNRNQLPEMNAAIRTIIENPGIGEQKKGDLDWLWVYKFSMCGQLTLIGYSVAGGEEIVLTFVAFGSHENFYRDIKHR